MHSVFLRDDIEGFFFKISGLQVQLLKSVQFGRFAAFGLKSSRLKWWLVMFTSLDAVLWLLNVWKSVFQMYSIKHLLLAIPVQKDIEAWTLLLSPHTWSELCGEFKTRYMRPNLTPTELFVGLCSILHHKGIWVDFIRILWVSSDDGGCFKYLQSVCHTNLCCIP